MFKKWICKRKGHTFIYTHIEPDGWGINNWYWKKCTRCGYATYDSKPVTYINPRGKETRTLENGW